MWYKVSACPASARLAHATNPNPAPDRASLSALGRLVPDRTAYGREADVHPRLSACERHKRTDDRLLRRASGAGRAVHLVQPVDRQDVPRLRTPRITGALLPFFTFNYWFVYEVPILNRWMALDFGANAAMLGLSVWGWRVMGRR
jgi:hypothetical protein